jgi:hypothetical protein
LARVKADVVRDIERGRTKVPAYDKLIRLAFALRMPASDLLPVKLPKAS